MRNVAAILVGTMIAGAPSLGATSFVSMTDQALADQSPIIVEARIEQVEAASFTDRAYTDYRIRIERRLKGSGLGPTALVRVLGGILPDGTALRIAGAPRFAPGERVILFLAPRRDGTWGILQFLLGAFHERRVGDQRLALRDLTEAHEVSLPGQGSSPQRRVRDFAGFARWLSDRAAGLERGADYFVVPPERAALQEKFHLSETGGGLNVRWFEFDDESAVVWYAHEDGVSGMANDEFAAFEAALAAWAADAESTILHAYGGTTSATAGFTSGDGVNAILWDDPNDEIAGSYSCAMGGALAIGGWRSSGTGTFNGTTFARIVEGDVVTQDGAGCTFDDNGGKDGEETFAHELGHALGLSHSCYPGPSEEPCDDDPPGDDEALMRALAHSDGRGAALGDDDRAAIKVLYGSPDLIFADGFESGDTARW